MYVVAGVRHARSRLDNRLVGTQACAYTPLRFNYRCILAGDWSLPERLVVSMKTREIARLTPYLVVGSSSVLTIGQTSCFGVMAAFNLCAKAVAVQSALFMFSTHGC